MTTDRRSETRGPSTQSRRRYPRFKLDVDWFVESSGCSTLGRHLEISVRGAVLPVTCTSPFTSEVTLYISFASRPKMFKARCAAVMKPHGWVLRFHEVAPDDLQLLGNTLISEYGVRALPNLTRRFGRFADLPAHALR